MRHYVSVCRLQSKRALQKNTAENKENVNKNKCNTQQINDFSFLCRSPGMSIVYLFIYLFIYITCKTPLSYQKVIVRCVRDQKSKRCRVSSQEDNQLRGTIEVVVIGL